VASDARRLGGDARRDLVVACIVRPRGAADCLLRHEGFDVSVVVRGPGNPVGAGLRGRKAEEGRRTAAAAPAGLTHRDDAVIVQGPDADVEDSDRVPATATATGAAGTCAPAVAALATGGNTDQGREPGTTRAALAAPGAERSRASVAAAAASSRRDLVAFEDELGPRSRQDPDRAPASLAACAADVADAAGPAATATSCAVEQGPATTTAAAPTGAIAAAAAPDARLRRGGTSRGRARTRRGSGRDRAERARPQQLDWAAKARSRQME